MGHKFGYKFQIKEEKEKDVMESHIVQVLQDRGEPERWMTLSLKDWAQRTNCSCRLLWQGLKLYFITFVEYHEQTPKEYISFTTKIRE